MKDHLEDKLGMCVKVDNFLITNSTTFSSVIQIGTEQGLLHGYINDIMTEEGTVSGDFTGFTLNKESKRIELETITFKVAGATAAYFLSIGNSSSLKMADYTRTELHDARDSALYAKAKRLFTISDPVKTSLTAFNSGPSDVSALDTKKENYFGVIQDPAIKKDDRKTASQNQKKLFRLADKCLVRLDTYMLTFEASQPTLFAQYRNHRSIDDTGAHSHKLLELLLNIAINSTTNINTSLFAMQADYVIILKVPAGLAMLEIGFGPDGTSIASPVSVDAGTMMAKTASQLGFSGVNTFLNVRNPSASTAGGFVIKVRT
jgi:hypothetical protein